MTKGNCSDCAGDGYKTSGHHDQWTSTCRYCEGTGTRKWERCRNCNKFGEIDAPELGFLCSKKCPVCQGTKRLSLGHYDCDYCGYYMCSGDCEEGKRAKAEATKKPKPEPGYFDKAKEIAARLKKKELEENLSRLKKAMKVTQDNLKSLKLQMEQVEKELDPESKERTRFTLEVDDDDTSRNAVSGDNEED